MIKSILEKDAIATPAGLAKEIVYLYGVGVMASIPMLYQARTGKTLTNGELSKVSEQYEKISERIKKYLKIGEK